jgi:hypothetical protein
VKDGEATLPAPAYFNDEQGALWNAIIASHGAGYFHAGNAPLLEQFCILSVAARDTNMPQRERVQVALCSVKLASAMRLSQFSSLQKPKRQPHIKPIWQNE